MNVLLGYMFKSYTLWHELLAEKNFGKFGESLVVYQILTMFCDIYKESKQAGIHQSFTHQKVLMRNSPMLSILHQKFALYGMLCI